MAATSQNMCSYQEAHTYAHRMHSQYTPLALGKYERASELLRECDCDCV